MYRDERILSIDANAQPLAGGTRIVVGFTVALVFAGSSILYASASDERHAKPDAQAPQEIADDKAIGERLKAAGGRIKAAVADGEMTKEEAKTAWREARDEIIATAVKTGEITEEAAAVYRDEVRKGELDERLEELSDKIRTAVATGEMTEDQGQAAWYKEKDELIQQAVDDGEVSEEDATTLRRNLHKGELQERLGEAGRKIKTAIVKGEMTKDEGWAEWYTVKEQIINTAVEKGEVSEEDAAAFRSDIHKAELGIRLREAGGEIRAAIKSGEMTEDQGWAEWDVVKEKLITTAVNSGEVSEEDAAVFRRDIARAEAGQKLKRAVANGEITEEEAWAKWDEINEEADNEPPGGDTESRLRALGKKIYTAGEVIKGAVANGKLTKEEAATKWNKTKERIIKDAVKAGRISEEEAGIMHHEVEKAEAAEKLRKAIAKGEMTEEEALAKWTKIKTKMDAEHRRRRAIETADCVPGRMRQRRFRGPADLRRGSARGGRAPAQVDLAFPVEKVGPS